MVRCSRESSSARRRGLDPWRRTRTDCRIAPLCGEHHVDAAPLRQELLRVETVNRAAELQLALAATAGLRATTRRRLLGEDVRLTTRLGEDVPRVHRDPSQVRMTLAPLCRRGLAALIDGAAHAMLSVFAFLVDAGPAAPGTAEGRSGPGLASSCAAA